MNICIIRKIKVPYNNLSVSIHKIYVNLFISLLLAHRAGSDGSMSASGSAGPGFNPWHGSKFSIENFRPRG